MSDFNSKKQDRIIIKNGTISIGFKVLEYIITFLTVPLLMRSLGISNYGVYSSVFSLVSWIYYFDLGIGSGLRNKLAECIVNGDYDTASECTKIAYTIVTLISIIMIVLFVWCTHIFDFNVLLNANLNSESLNNALIVAVVFACANFVLSLALSVLYAVQMTAFVSGLSIFSKVIMYILIWLFGHNNEILIISVVAIEGVSQFLKNILATLFVIRNHKQLMPKLGEIKFKYAKYILGFGIQIFIMQISALVLNATDNLLIMKLFSASDVTPYSMCHRYFSVINAFFVAATGPLWTAYTAAYTSGDVGYIKQTIKRALYFYTVTLIGIMLALLIFKPFMKIYLGEELVYQNGLVIIVASYYALLIFSHNFSAFVHGISKTKITTIACFIGAVANIPLSIFFANKCGMKINGIMMGSIASLIITTFAYVYTTIVEIQHMEEKTIWK